MITYQNINVSIDTGLAEEIMYMLESGYARPGTTEEERAGLKDVAKQIRIKLKGR